MKERRNVVSIRLKFRASSVEEKEGSLFYQIICDRSIRRIATRYHIYKDEWDERTGDIVLPEPSNPRCEYLKSLQGDIAWEIKRFEEQVRALADDVCSMERLVMMFQGNTSDGKGVFDYLRGQSLRLMRIGRVRCSETMDSTLRSFMQFRGGVDLCFERLDRDMIERYEVYMREKRLTRNTSSFYMRNLRVAYNNAVYDGLAENGDLFNKVYTGVDKTSKRAISINDLRKIKNLDVAGRLSLSFAKDILLFCFYTRGMSFVDMANLRKKDISDGYIVYQRKKTGQRLSIEVVPEIRAILNKYKTTTQYLLPLITREDGTERRQYKNQLARINRNLKTLGCLAGISVQLTTYVMRHTWASIAHSKGIALAVISEGLGHDSEVTTQIYLDSIRASEVDKANRAILDDL